MARGVIEDDHPLAMGYADGALNKAVHEVFREADVVLLLGKRLDYRLAMGGARLFSPGAKFIQVDFHAAEFGHARPIHLPVAADVRAALAAFNAALGPKRWPPKKAWMARQRERRDAWRAQLARIAREAKGLHPAALFAALAPEIPKDALIAWDGGDFTHWGRATIPARVPGGWLRLGPLGTIGSALPNAFTLRLAHPGRPVVMITGDGSLGFYLAELDSLVRYGLPVVIIVGNDAGWGLERELQGEVQGSTVACELRPTRYDTIMKGFGGEGETITRVDQVAPAFRRGLASGVPYLINARIQAARSPFTDWQLAGKAGSKLPA
jgi:acetolactate synthase-1/2/3 large subunit